MCPSCLWMNCFPYQWMNKMSCNHPYITLLLMDEKNSMDENIRSYGLSRWWCMHRKQRARQYGGLVNLDGMTNPKAWEPLDKRVDYVWLANVGVSIKCGYKQFITFARLILKAIFEILVFLGFNFFDLTKSNILSMKKERQKMIIYTITIPSILILSWVTQDYLNNFDMSKSFT